ncbi:hypothetical protein BDV33DRAFT_112723 [Aspergillus novoparasiticus]|uniref:Uncharacterized protein n=1 Tax=Aspergillus novoparasiticus TaxID=986946 RepID=A0A5N6F8L1_9EURO|nr:hypothetical protein BDV33DRAFT_112723 [Aspergillus novoparasiticus]
MAESIFLRISEFFFLIFINILLQPSALPDLLRLSCNPLLTKGSLGPLEISTYYVMISILKIGIACPSAYERSFIEKCVRVPKDTNLLAVEARAQLNPGFYGEKLLRSGALRNLSFMRSRNKDEEG